MRSGGRPVVIDGRRENKSLSIVARLIYKGVAWEKMVYQFERCLPALVKK
jgi:hypothetical protein